MKLNELFLDPIERPIDPVIKADDRSHLKTDINEYVITREIEENLDELLDTYITWNEVNGVWISGFFGSGKSHLLKMLSLLLENPVIDGFENGINEAFRKKIDERETILKGKIRRLASIPSKSILFNIIQVNDVTAKDKDQEGAPVLIAFQREFDDFCGYYGSLPHIAEMERQLDENGQYEVFKAKFKEFAGEEWENGRRKNLIFSAAIDKAFAAATNQDEVKNIQKQFKDNYHNSPKDFAGKVKTYIDKQEKNFRLNFFVDEIGQFIVRSKQLMSMLQTIAESLATICKGRSYIFVTAQEEMDKFIGNLDNKAHSDDFSTIRGRFKCKMHLSSKNVDEVIERRLLRKKPEHVEMLRSLYRTSNSDFPTLFNFSDDSISFKLYENEDDFINKYPFVPYQFDLFQQIILQFSDQNVFEGKFSSVGERSMLDVFQKVLIALKDEEIGAGGTIVPFYRTYDGVQSDLISAYRSAINLASKNMAEDPFTVNILKTLFLVRFYDKFTSNEGNIRILMENHLDQDLPKLREQVHNSLVKLEKNNYIQRNGDTWSFLTDEQKEIENDIQNKITIDDSDIGSELKKLLFDSILNQPAIRYDKTGRDYKFTKLVDGFPYSPTVDLSVNIATTFNDDIDHPDTLVSHSFGKKELLIILQRDDNLEQDLRHYLKTARYLTYNSQQTQSPARNQILRDLGALNNNRREGLKNRLSDALKAAKWLPNGAEAEIMPADPKAMLQTAFIRLIELVYPNLQMIVNKTFSEKKIKDILNAGPELLETQLTVEERDVRNYIGNQHVKNPPVTIKDLMDQYTADSYGWYTEAVQCILARLLKVGKIELHQDGTEVAEKYLFGALTNSRFFNAVQVVPLKDYDKRAIRELKKFYEDFFSKTVSTEDPKELAALVRGQFDELMKDLNDWLNEQDKLAAFIPKIKGARQMILPSYGKSNDYYLNDLADEYETLLGLNRDFLSDFKAFHNGNQYAIYKNAAEFLDRESDNLSELRDKTAIDELGSRLADPECYQNGGIPQIKKLHASLQNRISEMLIELRQRYCRNVDELEKQLQSQGEYADLTEEQKQTLAAKYAEAKQTINQQNKAWVIRSTFENFSKGQTTRLNEMSNWAAINKTPEPEPVIDTDHTDGGTGGGTDTTPVSPQPPVTTYVQARQLVRSSGILSTASDVDEYLEKLRNAYMQAISEGKKIQL